MTPAAPRALARVLGALLPWRTIGRLMDDPCTAHAAAARRDTACMTAGVEEREAVMGAESLAGSSFETSLAQGEAHHGGIPDEHTTARPLLSTA
jgi:hypothetical protein